MILSTIPICGIVLPVTIFIIIESNIASQFAIMFAVFSLPFPGVFLTFPFVYIGSHHETVGSQAGMAAGCSLPITCCILGGLLGPGAILAGFLLYWPSAGIYYLLDWAVKSLYEAGYFEIPDCLY